MTHCIVRWRALTPSHRLSHAPDLQRYKKGWHTAVLIRGKLLLFSPAALAADDALCSALPRHVYSLDGVTLQHTDGSQQLTLLYARTGKMVRLCATSHADAHAWWRALRDAAQQPRVEVPLQLAAPPAVVTAQGDAAVLSGGGARDEVAAIISDAHAAEEELLTPAPAAAHCWGVGQAGEAESAPPSVAQRGEKEHAVAMQHPGAPTGVDAEETQPHGAAAEHVGFTPAASRVMEAAEAGGTTLQLAESAEEAGAPAAMDEAAAATATAASAEQLQAEEGRAAARSAVEQQAAWLPRSTHEQVEAFLRRFPDVERRDAYRLRAEFDAFDLAARVSASAQL
jgi:hypothetical protein